MSCFNTTPSTSDTSVFSPEIENASSIEPAEMAEAVLVEGMKDERTRRASPNINRALERLALDRALKFERTKFRNQRSKNPKSQVSNPG